MYREVALNCIRFLDYKSLEDVDRLTIAEYKLLMEGVRLRELDKVNKKKKSRFEGIGKLLAKER